MTPFGVVEHLNVINYVSFGFFPGPVICEKYTLSLQATEKALSYSVIPAVTLSAHTAYHFMSLEHLLKIIAAILAATVRVKYEIQCWPAAPCPHKKSIHDQFPVYPVIHRPDYNLARKKI
jgi:hypothetical protein